MAFTYFNGASLRIFSDRLEKLSASSVRRWGSMSAGAMLEHLIILYRVSLGEVDVEDRSTAISRSFVGYLVFRWIPWPKGRLKTFPFMLPPSSGTIEEQKERLLGAMHRFTEQLSLNPERKTVSPLLGPTTLRQWSLVHGKHTDHHFKQFGC
jgi:oxepin-CoA hydrolase / 3-oxo-5,6-dehydrosuberyl-CoA semialdehyde dehydrogenase